MIEQIYKDGFYKGFCNTLVYSKTDKEELYSEFILKVCELDKTRLKDLMDKKEFKYYAVGMIRNLVYNKYSTYNKNNKIFAEITDDLTEEPKEPNYFDTKQSKELLKKVEDYVNIGVEESSDAFYHSKVFQIYYKEYNNFRAMSKETKIPISSLHNSLKKTNNNIKQTFCEEYKQLTLNKTF